MLSWRKAARKVEGCEWPQGTGVGHRCPLGLRPERRAILVFNPVSSINTSRRTSQLGCCRRQRLRAALTSGRSCSAARVVFFIAQSQSLQTMPQGRQADGHLQLLPALFLQLAQGQTRLPDNPTAQGPVMLFQAGAPIAADWFGLALAGVRVLFPKPFHALATDPKTLAHDAGAFSACARGDDPLAQILT